MFVSCWSAITRIIDTKFCESLASNDEQLGGRQPYVDGEVGGSERPRRRTAASRGRSLADDTDRSARYCRQRRRVLCSLSTSTSQTTDDHHHPTGATGPHTHCMPVPPFDAHCFHMGTAIKHPVPYQIKPSFVIFDIRTLWRSVLSARVSECQKLQMMA